jgi:hypothetical protein
MRQRNAENYEHGYVLGTVVSGIPPADASPPMPDRSRESLENALAGRVA